MEPTSLLKEYAQTIGLPALAFDAFGCARLRFASGIDVNLELDPAQDCIHLYAVLGPVPPGPKEHLYEKLLKGNLFGVDTSGASLSIDAARNEFLLCARAGSETSDATAFGRTLEGFAAVAVNWSALVAQGSVDPVEDSARPPIEGFDFFTHLRA